MNFLIQGLIFGIAYIAPIGMQNLYVINSALEHSRRRALTIALIVAAFDMSLALASFFGIGQLLNTFAWLKMVVLFVGSLIVMYIGIGLLRENTTSTVAEDSQQTEFSYRNVIIAAFSIAWLNPQAIIDGTMLLGAFKASLTGAGGNIFILGVCIASITWFIILTLIVNALSSKFNPKFLLILNRVCGVIIILYGVKLIWNFIQLF